MNFFSITRYVLIRNLLLQAGILFIMQLQAQNVGVGTSTPAEKLDVNGNINVSGTIKANGTDGTPNQVLMKNSSGNLAWGDLCEFKNMATFTSGLSSSWNIPANVTRVWVELWGGGGGGNFFIGGGAGAYISAILDVTSPGSITYTIGSGGAGATSSDAASGLSTSITYTPASITLTANGGTGALYNSTPPALIGGGSGGTFSVPIFFSNYIAMRGGAGSHYNTRLLQYPAATQELLTAGTGGDAPMRPGTGGQGNTALYNHTTSTLIQYTNGLGAARIPGGGGGGGCFIPGGIALQGNSGASGMVIFHY